MQIAKNNHNKKIFFGHSRVNSYTTHQLKVMRDMKKAAIDNHWCDIYSGEKFSHNMLPTIEHLVPCSFKKTKKGQQLIKTGFQINGLENIFPVASMGNTQRQSQPFTSIVINNPKILTRLLNELEKYKKYKSNIINGDIWFNQLLNTIIAELAGIKSNIKTKTISIG